MQFKSLNTVALNLQTQLQWLWYSDRTQSFIVGDDQKAFAVSVTSPIRATPLESANLPGPCNLPIPLSLYSELATQPWHGFRFMEPAALPPKTDGDLLRTLVFGPNYAHPVQHPASGLVLTLRSGSMTLLDSALTPIDKTKTRGSSTLVFAAHPTETLLAYGDNAGNFHAHRFDATGFGKANKIAARERNASRVEFTKSGQLLGIGGMGYLATCSYANGKFSPAHEIPISVRDFLWLDDGELVLVNQGMHGIAAYRYDQAGFTKLGSTAAGTVNTIVASKCQRYLAVSMQDSPAVSIYEIIPA